MPEKPESITPISLSEFRKHGFLILINSILHIFGMALVVDSEKDMLYPARTTFRGFPQESMEKMYSNITKYLDANINDLKNAFLE